MIRVMNGCSSLYIFTYAKVRSGFSVDGATGLTTIEMGRTCDEIRHVIGIETVTIELAWMALGQHKGLADMSLCINVTEIRSRVKTVVATRTQHKPA